VRLVLDDDESAQASYALYSAGSTKPGHNIRVQAELLDYLATCEAQVGNLREAKRLAAENFVNPTVPVRSERRKRHPLSD